MNNFLCRFMGWALLSIAMNGMYARVGYAPSQRFGMVLALGFAMIFITARKDSL